MTGETVETLRGKTLAERRKIIESRYRRPMWVVSRFPLIGRGDVLRDRLISSAEVNARLDQALR